MPTLRSPAVAALPPTFTTVASFRATTTALPVLGWMVTLPAPTAEIVPATFGVGAGAGWLVREYLRYEKFDPAKYAGGEYRDQTVRWWSVAESDAKFGCDSVRVRLHADGKVAYYAEVVLTGLANPPLKKGMVLVVEGRPNPGVPADDGKPAPAERSLALQDGRIVRIVSANE